MYIKIRIGRSRRHRFAFLTISRARKIINPLLAAHTPLPKNDSSAGLKGYGGREETGASSVSGRVAGPSASAVTMATVSLRCTPPLPWDFKLLPFLLVCPGGAHQGLLQRRYTGLRGLLRTSAATAPFYWQRYHVIARVTHTHTRI